MPQGLSNFCDNSLIAFTFLLIQLLPLSHQLFFQMLFYSVSVIGPIYTIFFFFF